MVAADRLDAGGETPLAALRARVRELREVIHRQAAELAEIEEELDHMEADGGGDG